MDGDSGHRTQTSNTGMLSQSVGEGLGTLLVSAWFSLKNLSVTGPVGGGFLIDDLLWTRVPSAKGRWKDYQGRPGWTEGEVVGTLRLEGSKLGDCVRI